MPVLNLKKEKKFAPWQQKTVKVLKCSRKLLVEHLTLWMRLTGNKLVTSLHIKRASQSLWSKDGEGFTTLWKMVPAVPTCHLLKISGTLWNIKYDKGNMNCWAATILHRARMGTHLTFQDYSKDSWSHSESADKQNSLWLEDQRLRLFVGEGPSLKRWNICVCMHLGVWWEFDGAIHHTRGSWGLHVSSLQSPGRGHSHHTAASTR